jgi:hypothetical protein
MKKVMTTGIVLLSAMAAVLIAQEPEWNASRVKPCDRA